ncbi:hypothetical protein F5876DRAFT_82388 [Lentinula aff. lateritia]|uniref:Uncharacterized protein n=1 Tax=Lentinula aff. lateritia TaxID=2804960 RepID=A0ACC1TJU4_9AGAR|nr:hypothetical protein F5876DRAFT_82388 [Lentinula aff. lateritia]
MVEPRSVGSPIQTPLFLPEQESPTSPSPPPPSPNLPPLFGSVAPLSIDLTGDDDELYDAGEVDAVSRECHGVVAPVVFSWSSFNPCTPFCLPCPPLPPPVLPALAKPIADAMAAVSLGAFCASYVGARLSPPYPPIPPRS